MVSNKDSRKSHNSWRAVSFPTAVVFRSMCLASSIRTGLFVMNQNKYRSLIASKSKKISAPLLKITLIISIFHLPGTAYSCAVCFSGSEESLQAYYLTTVFLTLLPVLMLASIGYWIYRKHRGNWKDLKILIPLHAVISSLWSVTSQKTFKLKTSLEILATKKFMNGTKLDRPSHL